jgi:hypothetical protein
MSKQVRIFMETVVVYFEFMFDLRNYGRLNVVQTGYFQKSTCKLPLTIASRNLDIVFSLRPVRTCKSAKMSKYKTPLRFVTKHPSTTDHSGRAVIHIHPQYRQLE